MSHDPHRRQHERAGLYSRAPNFYSWRRGVGATGQLAWRMHGCWGSRLGQADFTVFDKKVRPYNRIHLEATQLFKFSRRPGLRRPLHQTERTRRRRTSFVCRIVRIWNRLPLVVASETRLTCIKETAWLLLMVFWATCRFPIIEYIHTSLVDPPILKSSYANLVYASRLSIAIRR